MRALVVYESMYGNTRAVAKAIAEGLRESCDVDAGGIGLREWLDTLTGGGRTAAAVFDTRFGGLSLLTGRAGLGIARALRRRGFGLVTAPKSFIVDKQNHVLPGEIEHATQWGRHIAPALQQRAGGTAR